MSYSLYFRRKVLCIKQKERLSYEESGKRFGIGKQTVYRWTKRLDPKLVRYKPPSKIDMERLEKYVEMYPDPIRENEQIDLALLLLVF
ncbi:IS630 transposase-related protein [Candidatus Lariskella endosymbiont of Hedychridium roseum]|uniref:IS630 transposase-related protein n=1 Tax=Candidatus Lariskella endosymbiont of Hedychridium roseum TaxID=3077949 RepID=UPI0039778FD4